MWSGRSTAKWQQSGGRQEGKLGPKSAVMATHGHGLGGLHNGRWSYHVSVALQALKLADRYKPGLLPGLLGEVPTRTRRSDKRTHAACSSQKCHMGRQPRRHCGHSEMRNSGESTSKGACSCSVWRDQSALTWQCHQSGCLRSGNPTGRDIPHHPPHTGTHAHACAHAHRPSPSERSPRGSVVRNPFVHREGRWGLKPSVAKPPAW